MKSNFRLVCLMALFAYHMPLKGEVVSFLFKDVITSNGQGNINLFRPKNAQRTVTSTILEQFRLDHNGKLVFAVDVNEASDGSENQDSQGISIKRAELVLEYPDEILRLNNVYTKTQALLREQGASDRSLYYTLLGVAGSGLVTPNASSELNGSSIDSYLSFEIDRDLTPLVSAYLDIELLETATGEGDPEAFYDFSNGFEEIALITREDQIFLDEQARGVALAPLVISEEVTELLQWSYFPSNDGYFIVAFEDLFPQKGDYDFNDLVVAFQVHAGKTTAGLLDTLKGHGFLVSRGASYNHDFYLGFDFPSSVTGTVQVNFFAMGQTSPVEGYPTMESFQGPLNLPVVKNIKTHFFDGQSTYVNSFSEQNIVQGPRFEFEINFQTSSDIDIEALLPFDPFLYVHDTQYEIHLNNKLPRLSFSRNDRSDVTQFKDPNNFPFALMLNETWMPPLAGIDMGLAYPKFMQHVLTNGSDEQLWYSAPDNQKIKNIPFRGWQW